MNPEPYLLRPSDGASVPAVFGVLGITLCRITPEGNQRPPWSRLNVDRGSSGVIAEGRRDSTLFPPSLPPRLSLPLPNACLRSASLSAPIIRPSDPLFDPARLPPRSRGCICYHSQSTTINKRRPSQNPHQTLYTPPGGAIFPEAGITSGGAQ